tara:strand:+ start:25020 stop:25520 length:501 start_codon:yes stop_codon:yes gene_type:complete
MDYYVSKKAGSIMFRAPKKAHLVAGDHIPAEAWAGIPESSQQELLNTGMVEGFTDVDTVVLADAPSENLPRVGSGNKDFMPEAKVQQGERVDVKLKELEAAQAKAAEQAKDESEVDLEEGGSADGVVQVELPADEDEDEDLDVEDSLTDEELEALREMEQEDQEEN